MTKRVFLACGVLLTVVVLAGCGGSTPSGPIKMTTANLRFTPAQLTVDKGDTVKLEITNKDSGVPHTFEIDELGVGIGIPPGGSAPIEFVADKTGTFTFYCGVPGHRGAGMLGQLMVR